MRTNLEIGIAVTEATTIAEEIAVEIAVVAVLDAADFAVALTRRHIAADRTARADARRILHVPLVRVALGMRSEEHTSELQSLMRISYAVFCLKKKKNILKIAQKSKSIQQKR